MKSITAIFFIVLLTLTGVGQEKLVIGESDRISFDSRQLFDDLDSTVWIVGEGYNYSGCCHCESIEVYYDKKMRLLDYNSSNTLSTKNVLCPNFL